MNPRMISGVALLLVGVVLFLFGMNAKDSLSDRVSNFFTGHFTEYTTWLLVLGLTAAIAGVLVLATGSRRSGG